MTTQTRFPNMKVVHASDSDGPIEQIQVVIPPDIPLSAVTGSHWGESLIVVLIDLEPEVAK